MDNKIIIEEFENKRCFYDENGHSFPYYLRNYLWAFGIECGYGMQNYWYNGEKLEIITEDDKIKFISPSRNSYVAIINPKSNEIYFKDGETVGSVRELDYYGGLQYAMNGRQYYFHVFSDMLGNITLSYNNRVLTAIRIGEKHKTPERYLKMVQDHIDSKVSIATDFRVMCTILNDPRIVSRLEELIKDMAPDIETAYQRRINNIKSTCNEKIADLLKEQENDIRELTRYMEKYVKEYGNDSIGEKGK